MARGRPRSPRYGRPIDLPQLAASYKHIPTDVLADLAEFCGASTAAPVGWSSEQMWRSVGRRDVWLRIAAAVQLDEFELFALLKGEPISRQFPQLPDEVSDE